MPIQRERELWARCAEPNTEEIFHGLLRWTPDVGLPEIDDTSPLVQLLGEHHAGFKGHKHNLFALFISEQLARMPPHQITDQANVVIMFPLRIGEITVPRQHDRDGQFIGFHAYGSIESYVK